MSQKKQDKQKQVKYEQQQQERKQARQQEQEKAKQQLKEAQELKENQHKIMVQETLKSMVLMVGVLPVISGEGYKLLGYWLWAVVALMFVLYVYQSIKLVYMTFPLAQRTWIKKIVPQKIKDVFDYFGD